MKVYLHLSSESDAGHIEEIKEVFTLERPTKLTPERAGLSLAKSKQVLSELQQIRCKSKNQAKKRLSDLKNAPNDRK